MMLVNKSDPVADYGLPASLERERFVLAQILYGGVSVMDCKSFMHDMMFSTERHKRIWRVMADMEMVSAPAVSAKIYETKQLDSVGAGYIVDLEREAIPGLAIDEHIKALGTLAELREWIRVGAAITDRCAAVQDESSLVWAKQQIESIGTGTIKASVHSVKDILDRIGINNFYDPSRSQNASRFVPVPSKWQELRRVLHAFRPKELIFIGGSTSEGKTTFAIDLGYEAAKAGYPVMTFSLEMAEEDLLAKIACNRADIDGFTYERGHMTSEERRRFMRATAEISELPLFFDDKTGSSVPAIESAIRSMRPRPQLVIVDYLQLLSSVGGKGRTRAEVVSELTRNLKVMAVQLEIPIIVISQLSRDHKKVDRKPRLDDLRESGSIEQDANTVIFVYAEDAEMATKAVTPVIVEVAKQRKGPKGKVNMTFYKAYSRFDEV